MSTSAQRYNAKLDRIWEQARIIKAKYAPLHMLTRLTEKVERINAIHNSEGSVIAEDWLELHALTNEARAVIEEAKKDSI